MRTSTFVTFRSVLLAAISAACGATTIEMGPTEDGGSGPDAGGGGPDGGASKDGAISSDGGVKLDGAVAKTSCQSPKPIVVAGKDTGYDQCANGGTRRRAALDCPSELPRPSNVCPFGDAGIQGQCSKDSDCNAKPLGYCAGGGQVAACFCSYGCTRDSDCNAGEICECGEPVGRCVQATCASPGSCGGLDCVSYDPSGGCGPDRFACQTPSDECYGDGDCAPNANKCMYDEQLGHRICQSIGCAIGRPFIVEGDLRLAPAVPRADWRTRLVPTLDGLSADDRGVLTAHWTEVAQLEHGSIAAFARFVLELLALGAPPELVGAAQLAMRDEIAHARIAFGFASAYAGAAIGPGPLDVTGAIGDAAFEEVLLRVVREGCVGETLGALEARAAAEVATDRVVRDALERIAEDETRHAALAWRTVTWMLRERTAGDRARLLVAIASELRGASDSLLAEVAAKPRAGMLARGVLGSAQRAELMVTAQRDILLPCLERLSAARAPAQPYQA